MGRGRPAHTRASLGPFLHLLSAPQAQNELQWGLKEKENQPSSSANPITRRLNYSDFEIITHTEANKKHVYTIL